MKQNTDKIAVLLFTGVAVMHLPCVDHQGISLIQDRSFSVDHQGISLIQDRSFSVYIISHFSLDNVDPFDVIVPVAGCTHIIIGRKICSTDI